MRTFPQEDDLEHIVSTLLVLRNNSWLPVAEQQ